MFSRDGDFGKELDQFLRLDKSVGFCLIFWLISSHTLFIKTEYLIQANTSIQGVSPNTLSGNISFFLIIVKSTLSRAQCILWAH